MIFFGWSVSISGDIMIIGAYGEGASSGGDRAGASYIFSKDQGGINNWGEVKKLIANDSQDDDEFGRSVSISGDIGVVGAYGADSWGAAYIFSKDQGGINNWGEVKKLVAYDSQRGFGFSVSISGDIGIVGAKAGAAYIFSKDQGGINNWGEVKKLEETKAQYYYGFGFSVSISGDIGFVGSHNDNAGGYYYGAAYIFEKSFIQPSPSPSSISPSPSPSSISPSPSPSSSSPLPSPSSISPSPSPNNEILSPNNNNNDNSEVIVGAIVGTLILSGLVIGGVVVMKRKNNSLSFTDKDEINMKNNELKKSRSQIGLFESSQENEKDGMPRRLRRRRRVRRKRVERK